MNYDDLKKYFNQFIYEYAPYRDDPIHKSIIDFLVNTVFDDSYNVIPKQLADLSEIQNPSIETIEKILLSVGIPPDIIKYSSPADQIILFTIFGDYTKYKSTIRFVREVAGSFSNDFIAYELYLDYRSVGGSSYDWYFIPKLVYNPRPDISRTVLKENPLSFNIVVENTKNFFLTKEYLSNLKTAENIILPIKTNILWIDFFVSYYETSVLNSLASSVILRHFSDTDFILYFTSTTVQTNFNVSILDMYIILYYVIMKRYDGIYNIKPVLDIPWYDPDKSISIDLSDLQDIFDEYNNIYSVIDYQDFFEARIKPYFLQSLPQFAQVNVTTLETILKSSLLLSNVINFIETELAISEDSNSLLESLVNDIFYSIETFKVVKLPIITTEQYEIDWFNFFVNLLPNITVDSPSMTSNDFLLATKPLHTEIVFRAAANIVTSNPDNTITSIDQFTNQMSDSFNSIYVISDYCQVNCLNEGDPMQDIS